MKKSLSNKNAVIFGGAGRIGKMTALAYLENGANVFIIDNNEKRIEELIGEIPPEYRNNFFYYCKSVNFIGDAKEITETVLKSFKKIDILVNCPAYIYRKEFINHPVVELDDSWNINVRIVFLVSQFVAKNMIANNGGKIINIASVGGTKPQKYHVSHCAVKAAVIAMSRVMALELAENNIQVNVVAPGPTETIPFSSDYYEKNPQALREIENKTPMSRIGNVNDHKGLMVFLASDESNWITGQVILSDGGLGLN
jgi:NAD(P)-dependent dehydrogenase (short-subunit alcohol dehydrogenase family)